MRNLRKSFCLLLVLQGAIFIQGCYSLSGISIDPNAKTFFVGLPEVQAELVEPTFARDFAERLKDKIRNTTRLRQVETSPDVEFVGTLTQFSITAESPQPGATAAFQRLTVSMKMEYRNNLNEKDRWEKTFTRFANFSASENFIDVKFTLLEDISKQIIEDVFTEAFAKNW
jgi:hypothetical protein